MTRPEKTYPLKARIARLKAFRKNTRGVAAIEFAMILPVMVLILAGLIDITNLFYANRKITLATNTIGDLITQIPNKITESQMDGIYNASRPILDPIPDDMLEISVDTYRLVGGAVKKVWHYGNGTFTCNAGIPETKLKMKIRPLMADGNDVVVTTGCVQVKTLTGMAISQRTFNLEETVILRPRQSDTLECDDCTS